MRESEFRHKYGLIAAGSLSRTLIARLPARSREIGGVAAASYRVASRIANSLRAGRPVRGVEELEPHAVLLFHAPPDQLGALIALCLSANFDWNGRSLIFCDCEPAAEAIDQFTARGASVAIARILGIAGFAVVQGGTPAMAIARRMVAEAQLKPLEIRPGSGPVFEAAVTLGTAALTPLIDRAAFLFRSAGIRDADSVRLAQIIFQQTVQAYAHSGRQSWAMHMGAPRADELREQFAAVGSNLGALLRQLVLLGFETFDRHPEIAALLLASGD